MTDLEAWMYLCQLHLQQGEYARALFCMEELIVSNPYNYLYYQKAAEVSALLPMRSPRSLLASSLRGGGGCSVSGF